MATEHDRIGAKNLLSRLQIILLPAWRDPLRRWMTNRSPESQSSRIHLRSNFQYRETCCGVDFRVSKAIEENFSWAIFHNNSWHGMDRIRICWFMPGRYVTSKWWKIHSKWMNSRIQTFAQYHSARNQFERFREVLELISWFEFEFCRRGNYFLNDSNFWCVQSSTTSNVAVHVPVLWPVCAHAIPFRMLLCP